MSSLPTGGREPSKSSMRPARRSASCTPRVCMPTSATSPAPLLRSITSWAMRLSAGSNSADYMICDFSVSLTESCMSLLPVLAAPDKRSMQHTAEDPARVVCRRHPDGEVRAGRAAAAAVGAGPRDRRRGRRAGWPERRRRRERAVPDGTYRATEAQEPGGIVRIMTETATRAPEAGAAKTYGNIIGGRSVPSPSTFASRSSSRLADVVGHFPEATKDQVREACEAAREAFKTWSRTPAPIRGQLIGQLGKALEREKESLSRLVTREMGKTLKEARGSVQEAIDTCHF